MRLKGKFRFSKETDLKSKKQHNKITEVYQGNLEVEYINNMNEHLNRYKYKLRTQEQQSTFNYAWWETEYAFMIWYFQLPHMIDLWYKL